MEIYDDFAKIYRKYRALKRNEVGDYFFKEMNDMVDYQYIFQGIECHLKNHWIINSYKIV